MTDPLKTRTVTLGGRKYEMRFSNAALRICQKKFGGTPVPETIKKMDMDVACEFGAAGIYGAGGKLSADSIARILDKHPEEYGPLAKEITFGVLDAYTRMVPKEDQEALGEEMAAVTGDAVATTTTPSASPPTGGPTSTP